MSPWRRFDPAGRPAPSLLDDTASPGERYWIAKTDRTSVRLCATGPTSGTSGAGRPLAAVDASGGGPPHRGPGRDGAGAPADLGRRAPVERTDQVVARHPGSGYPPKLTEPRLGCAPPGRRQERREQDVRARERLDDAGGLERLRLPLLPNRGVAEPLGDGLASPSGALFGGASRRRADLNHQAGSTHDVRRRRTTQTGPAVACYSIALRGHRVEGRDPCTSRAATPHRFRGGSSTLKGPW